MSEHYKVLVIKVPSPVEQTNADSLELIRIPNTDYQCVVKKGQFSEGTLAVYIPPDSIVPQHGPFEFLWADKEFPDGIVPEKYRRITVRKFRGQWSEGLLMPLSDFWLDFQGSDNPYVKEGDDVARLIGITHYEEPEPIDLHGVKTREQYKKWPPKSFMGWVYWFLSLLGINPNGTNGANEKPPKDAPPEYNVESYKHYKEYLHEGEPVTYTEKLHGSNARYMFDGKKMWVGSKKLWKSERSNCVWRRALKDNPWIESFCRAYPRHTLYGEVVPTQKGYDYGTKDNVRFFAFDIKHTAGWTKPWFFAAEDGEGPCRIAFTLDQMVPILAQGPYNEAFAKSLVDGQTAVEGAKHIREGIVISPDEERNERGLGRVQLKLKSMIFLEKERGK